MPSRVRTCVGCGRKAPKEALLRFVARDGRLRPDPESRCGGRGAYVCRDPACFELARRKRGFSRTLRQDVEVPPDLQGVWEEV